MYLSTPPCCVFAGGLYVLGHVKVGHAETEYNDPCIQEYPQWLNLVDMLKIKAFVELTLAPTVREGMNHLIRLSGLGGMKPNTVCMGFYDTKSPEDTFQKRQDKIKAKKKWKFYGTTSEDSDSAHVGEFPSLREDDKDRFFSPEDYFLMLCDTLKLRKNICLLRHFHTLDKDALFSSNVKMYIDVWPVNFFRPDTSNLFDNTCLFLLQLACILHMVPGWKKHTMLRIFMCVEEQNEQVAAKHKKLAQLLRQLRILGQIKVIQWHESLAKLNGDEASSHRYFAPFPLPAGYLQAVNEMVRQQCENTAVTFLYLPRVRDDEAYKENYLSHLETLTDNLPPTVLVHGIHPVTSTTM